MSPPPGRRAVEVRVSGRVQGVGFRAFVRRLGRELGLSGTVRNLPDGSVGVRAGGAEEAVEALLVALHEGPPASRVDRVEVVPLAAEPLEQPFQVTL
ncbi:MAG TPA: acylphosphatase [Thermoanaerobaculia bacterium]|nr:acylphosphatase [Thermoanaerobaculia bacterium]